MFSTSFVFSILLSIVVFVHFFLFFTSDFSLLPFYFLLYLRLLPAFFSLLSSISSSPLAMKRARWSSLSTLSWFVSMSVFVKVVSVRRSLVVPVRWPSVDRHHHRLSDGHLSVRPAESSVVVSVRPMSFWSSLLGGCLAILSAGRASQLCSWPHVLAVFSVARLGHALGCVSRPLFLIHHLAVFSAVHGHRPGHHCSATIVRLIYASNLTSARVSLCSCLILIVLFASP